MPAPLLRPALIAATALLFTSASAVAVEAQERHVLTGSSATIWNLAGEIRLEPGTGSDVVVEVTRGGSDGRRLEIVASGGQLRVRYPANEIVYRAGVGNSRGSTNLTVREDGTFNGDGGIRGRRTTVRTSGSGLEAHANLVVRVPAGRRVEVNLALGVIEANHVNGDLRLDVHAASVRTMGTKGHLVVDAGSGSVRVTDATGDVELDTGSGSLEVEGVRGTRLTLESGSGGIRLSNVTADRVSVDVGSGSVVAEGISTDDLLIDTGSGGVRADLTKVPRRTNIDTGSGSVTITLPANANAELDIETSSGSISSDFPVTMNEVRRRSLRGVIGSGGSVIRVSSGSGGVRVVKR